jgi:hypothetical protein
MLVNLRLTKGGGSSITRGKVFGILVLGKAEVIALSDRMHPLSGFTKHYLYFSFVVGRD